ncbi:MAG TPA: M42 family metallopeptidase [Trueperaceae bacterium]
MTDADKDFLQALLGAPGTSSFESRPAAVWRQRAEAHGAKVSSDGYGNSFATFHENGSPKVMLAGHIDEIGLIITYIDDNGLLYFKGVGGWDSQQLVGQRVRVAGYQGDTLGVVGKMPVHLMSAEDRTKVSKIENLWIDIGAKDGNEARQRIRVGDFAVIEQPLLELLNGRLASKAIDNRIGAYIVLEAARRARDAQAEVVAAATVQEEIGHFGALVAAYGQQPDAAIAVDVTHATDVPGIDKKQNGDVPLGSGASLSVGSSVHRGLFEMLVDTAETEGIPYTIETAPRRTATDADDIIKARTGVPTAVVSIPNRYMHSPNETIDTTDLENVIRLIVAFVERLDERTEFRQP